MTRLEDYLQDEYREFCRDHTPAENASFARCMKAVDDYNDLIIEQEYQEYQEMVRKGIV